MTSQYTLPPDVQEFVEEKASLLRKKAVKRLRFTPLLLTVDLDELLSRRRSHFQRWFCEPHDCGVSVSFTRKIRPTGISPIGRIVEGSFEILAVSKTFCLLLSSLDSDADDNGPRLFARKAYPLAKRPFISSLVLQHHVTQLAANHNWLPICVDAGGYDKKTQQFRRDMKRQPIDDALAEMSQQGRQLHKVIVSFRNDDRRQIMRVAFDRHCRTVIQKGNVELVLQEFVLPSVEHAKDEAASYCIDRADNPRAQEIVRLSFRGEPFDDIQSMELLCSAIMKGDGLSLSIIHLNPYLQSQVLDFLTGESLDILIMDSHSVCLIPRSSNAGQSMERVAALIFRFFGEAEVSREPI